MDLDVSPSQQRVLDELRRAGACTSRSLNALVPRPHWHSLLERGLLHEAQTIYGAVVGFSRLGLAAIETAWGWRPPYLQGPSALADRAYMMDALKVLEARGYRRERTVYKIRNPKLPARRDGRATTDQINYLVLRAPDATMRRLNALYPGREVDAQVGVRPDYYGTYEEAQGYPRLYASISGGGPSIPWVRRVLKKERDALDTWRHPLLIAVRDDRQLRPLVRSLATTELREQREHEAHEYIQYQVYPHYQGTRREPRDDLELVLVP